MGTEAVKAQEGSLTPPADATTITPEEGYTPAEVVNIFEDESISEAMLKGEDIQETPAPEDKPGEDSPADPEAIGDKDPEKTGDEDSEKVGDEDQEKAENTDPEKTGEEGSEKTGEDKSEIGKPPKGFVPIQALQEERGKRKEIAHQLLELQEAVELLGKQDVDTVDEFVILDDAAVENLIEEDPQEALRYQLKLQKHQAKQRAINLAKQSEDLQISEGVVEIQHIIPDIYEENSSSGSALADFAVEKGFNPEYLTLLTDPRTKLIAPDGKTKVVLGVGAASVIKVLNDLKSGMPANKDELRQQLEKEITEEVTQKVLAKIKGDPVPVSINDLPGAAEEIRGDTILSEAQLSKMSKAEVDAYLRGG